ncbi:MAG: hypothetical protein J6V68_03120 [Clostridia bacterium]|nr:hypothetical protein [Clostridia bacterium]
MDLPIDYSLRMKELLKDEYDEYINSFNDEPIKAFRVNTAKISVEDFAKINPFKTEKIPYADYGYYYEYDKIGTHPYHHLGLIYCQEPGAMAPIECIDIKPDWHVLDVCSAPGGKSTQIANKLNDNGVIVSNEIISSRCKILVGNIERLGIKNAVTTCMDTTKLSKLYPNVFNLVVVDAPCSGEGMFRKDETAIKEWSVEHVNSCAKRQSIILENASKTVKNGGYLIYSTCTFSLEENEKVVDEFLSTHPNFELIKVNEKVLNQTTDGIIFDGAKNKNLNFCRRFYPHKNKGEGQFMALFHNTVIGENAPIRYKNSEKAPKEVINFLSETLTDFDKGKVIMYNDKPVYFNPNFPIFDGAHFTVGVTIGEIKKNYILPHHQFFSSLGNKFKNKIELSIDSDELKKYLHGEEFETTTKNGYAVITVNGVALGGVKVVNGTAKNHYPKGLRTAK